MASKRAKNAAKLKKLGAKAVEVLRPVLYYGFLPDGHPHRHAHGAAPVPRRPVHAHVSNGADTRRRYAGATSKRSASWAAGVSLTFEPQPSIHFHDLPNSIPAAQNGALGLAINWRLRCY